MVAKLLCLLWGEARQLLDRDFASPRVAAIFAPDADRHEVNLWGERQ